ncbi:MAG: 50S ribosomal protein L23 [Patescibacteria group bacterium]|jgi:large subunit ribosomal protein L23|nr:50S ribosomal protein L23 [Patescibacteria group bacterium]
MGILDKFKSKKQEDQEKQQVQAKASKIQEPKSEVKPEVKVQPKKAETKAGEIKGASRQAFRVLVKPLITEKATELGVANKYVFSVDPKMNKVEVKKAIRSIYKVDPIQVNIMNFSGKRVRYGRVYGSTKAWKKAVVTLKPGDKIEVYEGV